jgi:broad specificity phosphatase PhoE
MTVVEVDLFRHGHSRANEDPSLVIGQSLPAPLSEQGMQQAEALGEYIVSRRLRPDIAYHSPAERARATAAAALGVLGVEGCLPILPDARLLEQSLGEHEGRPRASVYTRSVRGQLDIEKAAYRHPGGESMLDASERMHDWLEEAALRATREGQRRVHGYSHNTAMASLLARLAGAGRPDEMQEYVLETLRERRIGYASRTLIVYERGRFRIEHIGEPTAQAA